MRTTKRWLFKKSYMIVGWISVFTVFMVMGCATAQKEFDPDVKGPQMIVEPETIRLGVARVMGTQFVFKGKGFDPGDSVFIQILGVKKGDATVDIPIFDGEVDEKGEFNIQSRTGYDPSGLTFKIGVLLRAATGTNEKGETTIVITQPPIDTGVYTVKAVSMDSDKTAESRLVIKGPSLIDGMKDWMGGLMGKIEKK